eukprot:COSAG02_NODE_46979_length_342_cov_1.371429_1_plen_66_part_10
MHPFFIVTPGAAASDYTCRQGVAAIWLAQSRSNGGQALWSVAHQLTSMWAQWVWRMLQPAGPNEAL